MRLIKRLKNIFVGRKQIVSLWRVEMSDGVIVDDYTIYDFGDAASVLSAFVDKGRVMLVLQESQKLFPGGIMLTCQAGAMEKEFSGERFVYTETPDQAACREVLEESGLKILTLTQLETAYRFPSKMCSKEYCFLGIVAKPEEGKLRGDLSEGTLPKIMSWNEVKVLVMTNPEMFDVITLRLILSSWHKLENMFM